MGSLPFQTPLAVANPFYFCIFLSVWMRDQEVAYLAGMDRSLFHVRVWATIVEAPLVRTNGILMVLNVAFKDSTENA